MASPNYNPKLPILSISYPSRFSPPNCVAACERCNARKGDRTPDQAGLRLRRRPVRPEWKPFYAAQGARIESWAQFLTHEPALAMA